MVLKTTGILFIFDIFACTKIRYTYCCIYDSFNISFICYDISLLVFKMFFYLVIHCIYLLVFKNFNDRKQFYLLSFFGCVFEMNFLLKILFIEIILT